jgi:hypothetical protein
MRVNTHSGRSTRWGSTVICPGGQTPFNWNYLEQHDHQEPNFERSAMSRLIRYLVLVIGCTLLIGAGKCVAQTSTGEVNGSVTDPGGAFIINAKITLTSDETGVKREAQSNQDGRFCFRNVQRPSIPSG